MKLDKYYLNLAGEYRVCSELLKRGIFATVTLGNMKGCDVVAVGANRRAAVIEVKTSQSTRFVTGFFQKYKKKDQEHPTFWILNSVRVTGAGFDEQFFVLTHEELRHAQARRNHPGESLSYEECVARVAKGVDNVLAKDIQEHKDAWDKIVRWCSNPI